MDNTDALKKAAGAMYQRIKTRPGHLVSETPKSGNDTKFQEELYGAISDLEDLKSTRSNTVPIAVKPKIAPKPAMRKSKSKAPVAASAGASTLSSPLQSETEEARSQTSERKSTMKAMVAEDQVKLHLMRSNRPLPPPPDAAVDDVYSVPSSIPATLPAGLRAQPTATDQRPLPALPDEDMGNVLYSTPSGLPAHGYPYSNSREILCTDAPYVNPNAKLLSCNRLPHAQVQTDCATTRLGAIQPTERPVSVHSHLAISQDQVQLPSIHLGSEVLTDVGEKLVVLENQMHSLSSVMGPVGPYKEMEKELARMRGRQMKLEAHIAQYEQRLNKLEAASCSMQQTTSSAIPSDQTGATKAALLSLSQEDTMQVLVALRLDCYCERFAHEGIDGPVLACMTERTMDELGMIKIHQARLLSVVNGYRSATELLDN